MINFHLRRRWQNKNISHLFLSRSRLISEVCSNSSFSSLLVDREFSRSFISIWDVWFRTWWKQKQRINSQKSVFRWQVHWQLLTFASTTWSLRVCSAVCVSRFVPISSIVAVWLWTTCDCMLATSRLLFFWRKFSNCTQWKGNTRCQSLLYERKMRSKTLKTQETQRNPSSAHPVITAESSTQNQTDRLQTKRF